LSGALPTSASGAVFATGNTVCTAVGTPGTTDYLVPNTIAGCATYKAAASGGGQVIKTGSVCDACSSGYILSGALPSTSVGAVFAVGSAVCTAVSATAGDLVPNKIDNCDKYMGAAFNQIIKTGSVCQTCATGYGVINNGAACVACSTGCSSCSNPGLAWCSTCANMNYLSTVFTLATANTPSTGVFSTGLPASCATYTTAGCAMYDPNSNNCLSCAAGYTQNFVTGSSGPCVANAKPASPASALQVQATLVAAMLVLLALFQ